MNEQGIHMVCQQWGHTVARSLIGGWQGENILSKFVSGRGTGVPGHIILAGLMGPDEERVNRGFNKLSDKLQTAFAFKYVYPNLPETSHIRFTNDILAKRLSHSLGYEVPKKTFLNRVDMAKRAIKLNEFGG